MTELPDDELDKLFRKSAEELDPKFEAEDWADLRNRLDRLDGRTPFWWLRKWWPLGTLLLLVSIGIVIFNWKEDSTQNEALKSQVAGSTGKNIPVAANSKIKNETFSEKSTATKQLQNENRVLVTPNPEEISKPATLSERESAYRKGSKILPRRQSKTGGVYLEPNRSKTGGGDGALILNENAVARQSENTVGERAATNGFNRLENPVVNNSRTVREIAEPVTAEASFEKLAVSADLINSRNVSWSKLQLPEITATEQPRVAPAKPVKAEVAQAKWAIRFSYSPDLSTVGNAGFNRPGTAVSLLAEVAVLPRLFVQSGAVWSRKDYSAAAGSYLLSSKWGYYTKPESVDGVCKVLEVPLNLRFDIVSGQKSRVFIGSGFSSYFMRGEKYQYNYEYPDDPHIKYTGWQGKTGWYWLSHLNASAGYEYRISQKLSILAEPYIRAPLKRVGYGKVNLFTTGAWISVRYTPSFR